MTQTNLAPTDPRSIFTTAVETAEATIRAVRPDQLGDPTPCDEYDVRTLMGHMLTVLGRVAALGDGLNPMAIPLITEGTPDHGWSEAWKIAAQSTARAWSDDATLDRLMVLPWVTAPGVAILNSYTSELTVHTWDLAKATGQQPAWDPQAIAISIEASRRLLPPGDREAAFEAMRPNLPPEMAGRARPFANPTEPFADAAPIDQLVAWYGRQPS
jgi:uncharacterized protein (TIGR03086 family)